MATAKKAAKKKRPKLTKPHRFFIAYLAPSYDSRGMATIGSGGYSTLGAAKRAAKAYAIVYNKSYTVYEAVSDFEVKKEVLVSERKRDK